MVFFGCLSPRHKSIHSVLLERNGLFAKIQLFACVSITVFQLKVGGVVGCTLQQLL